MAQQDPIAAIATALGEASIAVVRVSGEHSFSIVDRIFEGSSRLSETPSHRILYGHLVTLEQRKRIDEVIVLTFRSPKSYTTEDVVEIHCHGGVQAVQSILLEVLRAGARLAEPGEFTKRAFLGGRIDLSQAEGVMEAIGAKTPLALQAALSQVEGALHQHVETLRHTLIQTMAHLEVTIDYPEHDEEEMTVQRVRNDAQFVLEQIRSLRFEAERGRILREGVKIAIVGKPNVGKSSLLNRFARTNRAIVTEIPGTTRDVIEERIQIDGIPLLLFDTAGVRETEDVVEQIGVQKSRETLEKADLILLLLDTSRPLDENDESLLESVDGDRSLLIMNKRDLPFANGVDWQELAMNRRSLAYSTRVEADHDRLEQEIKRMVFGSERADPTFLANARHLSLLERAEAAIKRVLDDANSGVTLDLVAVDLHEAWMLLGEMIGETPREDLLDQIFSQFCLGK
ncbi:tRNA uridine-5-carboxymethylaminomethyl(34) synthesis GTPase MnmE [Ferroacidibacillus organovorans]|uniref:tRNA modification GTPase MnmE n=1 Tax=Ferroacidibacillus organovorans TaxID=1765683 RepID=A0A162TGI5_9BACL|nr:tRNA uridine-5-carboxymethylaminomethyl(34) synthesis GTPase MnmE [Ferroacidibacillus organovorans]KYP80781.1 tRNA modification GTPase [Ferroacidibacillus organovorans]OAG93563.1 tRNA modification GTPase [Ferroacidibacillus organovorans]OPG16815.1 tRNA uridine-5-carboxymethylaminomethyl(34) synthesis GTPase MnmE [Ferroacidibacillus organovorans]